MEIFLSAELREMGVQSLSETTIKVLSSHLDKNTETRRMRLPIVITPGCLVNSCVRVNKNPCSHSSVSHCMSNREVSTSSETLGPDLSSFEFAIETREYIRNILRSFSAFAHWTQSPSLAQFVEDLRLTMRGTEFRWDARHPFCESVEDLEVELYDNQLSLRFRFALWDRIDLYLKEYSGYLHC